MSQSDTESSPESLLLASGWLPELAVLEQTVLIDSLPEEEIEVVYVQERAICAPSDRIVEAARRSSLVSEVLHPHHSRPYITQEEHVELAFQWCEEHLVNDGRSLAVRSHRQGLRLPDWSGRAIEQALGGRLHAAGWRVDLESPDLTFRIIAINNAGDPALVSWESPVIAWGVQAEGPSEWESRTAPNRPFFKPVSLDPRLARAMVNLACPEGGRILDPFCGTGGILIEAAIVGLEACGSDLDKAMVEGSDNNIQWIRESYQAAGEPQLRQCSASDVASVWEGTFDGFAFDPPYGRNSWESDDGWQLFRDSLHQCDELASEEARLVTLLPWSPDANGLDLFDEDVHDPTAITFGKPWSEVLDALECAGWTLDAYVYVPVHGSLSRLLITCTAA